MIENGQVARAKSYGLADVGQRRPATTQTLFQAASISKPVSATAALVLVDNGLLTLDADVNAKLRSWKIPLTDSTRSLLCGGCSLIPPA